MSRITECWFRTDIKECKSYWNQVCETDCRNIETVLKIWINEIIYDSILRPPVQGGKELG